LFIGALVLVLAGGADLVGPALLWFAAWQCQETLRRVLFSELRHRAALLGDAISYLGQAAGVAFLALNGALTLPRAMVVLALTSAAAAFVQYIQVNSPWRGPQRLRQTANAFWAIGRWSLASSIATALRVNGLMWLIALVASRSDVAQFQATLNVVSVVNPVLMGLCNIIPQTAARASNQGLSKAWRVTLQYASLGFLPILFYYAFAFTMPGLVLRTFYGGESPYLAISAGVQIMSMAYILNYICEMVCSYLHGVNTPKTALYINLTSNVALAALAIPLVILAGFSGACVALAAANGFRLLLSLDSLRRLIVRSGARPA
jgi:O-antigen/teichoic acid export membrane protein